MSREAFVGLAPLEDVSSRPGWVRPRRRDGSWGRFVLVLLLSVLGGAAPVLSTDFMENLGVSSQDNRPFSRNWIVAEPLVISAIGVRIMQNTLPGPVLFEVRVNGTPTAMTTTIPGLSTAPVLLNQPLTIAAGDEVSFRTHYQGPTFRDRRFGYSLVVHTRAPGVAVDAVSVPGLLLLSLGIGLFAIFRMRTA